MVRKHPVKNLWEARYVAADGRKRSIYAKTRHEAQERLRSALVAADHMIVPVAGPISVGAWLDEWLATAVRARCRETTVSNYGAVVRLYIKPAIGRVQLAKLTPEHVQRMLADLTARGNLSPTTVRYSYAVLRIALGRAFKSGRVHRNVCTLVDAPAKARPQLAPLSAEDARAFLAATSDDRFGPLYALAIATGLRQGELLALRWADVDLDAATLAVNHTLTRGSRVLAEPKTERARRTLRLGSEAVLALREQRRRQLEERLAAGRRWHDGGFIFTTPAGDPLDGSNVLHDFQAAIRRAALPHQRFHDLRHATATLLIEAGEELGVVSKILGHSNIGTTADVYAHPTPAMSQRVADRLDGILRSPAAAG